MPDVVYGLVGVLLWAVAVRRASDVLRPGPARSVWLVIVMFASAVVVQLSSSRRLLHDHLAWIGGEAWVWLTCAVIAASSARSLVLHTAGGAGLRRKTRANVLLALVGIGLVTISFLAGNQHIHTASDASFRIVGQGAFYAGTWQALLRWAVWLGYLTWALIAVAHEAGGYAAQKAAGRLTAGLRLGAIGCQIGYGYVGIKAAVVVTVVGRNAFTARTGTFDAVADEAATLSVVIIVTGTMYDEFSGRITAARRSIAQRGTSARLHPFWKRLTSVVPEAVAHIPTTGSRQRLSRRVLDIRDCQLALRPYVSNDAPRRALSAALAAGLQGRKAETVAEAAWVEAARQRRLSGANPADLTDVSEVTTLHDVPGGNTLEDEARWISHVARVPRRSPIVRRFVQAELQDRITSPSAS